VVGCRDFCAAAGRAQHGGEFHPVAIAGAPEGLPTTGGGARKARKRSRAPYAGGVAACPCRSGRQAAAFVGRCLGGPSDRARGPVLARTAAGVDARGGNLLGEARGARGGSGRAGPSNGLWVPLQQAQEGSVRRLSRPIAASGSEL